MKNPVLMIIFLALIACGCSKEYKWDNPLDPANNQAPGVVYGRPSDGASARDTVNLWIYWRVIDPNPGDSILDYDVYFGSDNPPLYFGKPHGFEIFNDQDSSKAPYIFIEHLLPLTTYYWKINAWDNHGAIVNGPIWSFTTKP